MQNLGTIVRSTRGFTLIELLVVIVIIGVLATGAIAVFQGATAKARDSQRISDFEVLVKALQQYNTSYGYYPYSGDVNLGASTTLTKTNFKTVLTPYTNKWPVDPENTGGYKYLYCVDTAVTSGTDGQRYALVARMERDASAKKKSLADLFAALFGTNSDAKVTYIAGDNPELVSAPPTTTAVGACATTGTSEAITLD